MYLAPRTCCYITDLYDNAIAESGVAVHLLDLGMTLVQVQRFDLLVNCLEKTSTNHQ